MLPRESDNTLVYQGVVGGVGTPSPCQLHQLHNSTNTILINPEIPHISLQTFTFLRILWHLLLFSAQLALFQLPWFACVSFLIS